MSNQKQYNDPNDPLFYAPPWLNERNEGRFPPTPANGNDGSGRYPQEYRAPRPSDHSGGYARRATDTRIKDDGPPDIFAEAVAKALQEELEPEFVEVPVGLRDHRSLGVLAKITIAVGGAALIALAYALVFPGSEDDAVAALPSWQSMKSSMFPAQAQTPAPTLMVQDSDGPVNEPLLLGVTVNDPSPGAIVTIDRMPAGARLTAGKRMSASEWRVPAQQIAETSIIPPSDYIGEMNLSAALRTAEGTPLVNSFVRLTWSNAAASGNPVMASANASPAPVVPVAAAPPWPQVVASAAPVAPAAAPAQVLPEPMPELPANEIAAMVRRAQELMASGDTQAARLLLTRATRAHDSRAALLLAHSYDPSASNRSGTGDLGPDLEQARNWYQKAREWGSPDAQRQLDALASYR